MLKKIIKMKLRRKYECMFVNGQKIQFSIIHVLVLYGFLAEI